MAAILRAEHAWTEKDISAKAALDTKLRADPSDKGSLIALAMMMIGKGQLEQAEEQLKRAMIGDVRTREDAPQVLRKMGNACIALWRARNLPGGGGDESTAGSWQLINLSIARKQHVEDAVSLFDQALAFPENSASPAALYDSAVAKEHQGDLAAALEGLSQIIGRFPLFEGLNVIIFRAASILKHLGDTEQAIQYLEYVIDMPPVSHGYGLVYVLALLFSLYDAAKYTVKARRCRSKLRSVFVKANGGDEDAVPPDNDWGDGGDFHMWPRMWEQLAQQCLERCDYCLAVEFLSELITRAPSVPIYTVIAEAYWLLGEGDHAVKAAASAHELDQMDAKINQHLVEWAPAVWRPRLQQEAAARHDQQESVIEEKRIQAERLEKGRQVMRRANQNAKGVIMLKWQRAYELSSAATAIQKIIRRVLARQYTIRLRALRAEHERKVKMQVRKIGWSVMTRNLHKWDARVKKLHTQRLMAAGPMIRRAQQRVLVKATALWRREVELAIEARFQIRRAMDNKGPLYSQPLRVLSEFEAARPYHEARVAAVLRDKATPMAGSPSS